MCYTKIIITCLMMGIFAGCASAPKEVVRDQAKHNWVYVTETSSSKFYLDTMEVAEGEDRVAFLARVIFSEIQHTSGIAYKSSNVMFLVLKDKKQYAIYESHLYDEDGVQVHHSPADNNLSFSAVKNNSPIQKLYRESLKHL